MMEATSSSSDKNKNHAWHESEAVLVCFNLRPYHVTAGCVASLLYRDGALRDGALRDGGLRDAVDPPAG